MDIKYEDMVKSYRRHRNLKAAADELGMKWQTLYWYLSKNGEPVTGDKQKWGAPKDKLARHAELLFKDLIPEASDHNDSEYQAKQDFTVRGLGVDIKASTKSEYLKNSKSERWSFSCKKNKKEVSFLVCYCFSGFDVEDFGIVEKILLIPSEIVKNMQTVSVSTKKSKWFDYEISEQELKEFFDSF